MALQGRLAKPHRRLVVMPVEMKDALGLMIDFATFTVTLIALVVTIILALVHKKK
jgi:hypothetical protein